uniref:Protein llp n=1 Tax=Amblyomma triste TaxID=251400 RepID=A0A023GE02_AMBTT
MAKSLRSKWKRKMRAKKRERYSVKELAKLKEMLAAADSKNDTEMSDMCTVVDAKQVTERTFESGELADIQADDQTGTMDIDKPVRKYDPKTLRDEHGTYPVWMSPRAIRKLKAQHGRKGRKSASRKGVKKNGKRKSSR